MQGLFFLNNITYNPSGFFKVNNYRNFEKIITDTGQD